MTAIEQAFHLSVCEHPEDDTPRLIFADWLEENGQGERAEFIRVQCTLDGLLGGFKRKNIEAIDIYLDPQDWERQEWKHKVLEIHAREQELLTAHPEWGRLVADLFLSQTRKYIDHGHSGCVGNIIWTWKRGFPDKITLPYRSFFAPDRCKELFRVAPWEGVYLTDREPGWLERDPGFPGWCWNCPDRRGRIIPSTEISGGNCNSSPMFNTPQEAVHWLSSLLTAYGRSQAGLSLNLAHN